MTQVSTGTGHFARRGISLSTYSQAGYSDDKVNAMITRAVTGGANTVVLGGIVLADLHTGSIGDLIEEGRNQTTSLDDVGRAIQVAQAAGLDVVLKPQIAVHDAAFDQYNSASWINMVNPDLVIDDPARFFASYKALLLDWAALAERHGVQALSIGNEMVAATKPQFTSYWNDIIDAVRHVYHGQLTYAALAPVLTNAAVNEITQIGFWDKLDFAGFDVYPSLYHGRTPGVADLNAGWHDATVYGHRQDYVAFIDRIAQAVGKPVVFTETGLPSFDGASDREATSDGTIGNGTRATDQGEQADWWQSFFETWAKAPPTWLQGVWVVNNDPADQGSYHDQNYNIDGKLAEKVVGAWFGGRVELAPGAATLAGGQADDQLYLYDPDVAGQGGTLADHLSTTVTVVVTAGIAAGKAPVLHAYVNGADLGQVALRPLDSGYVGADGTHWTISGTYDFKLPGLVAVDDLRIAFDSPGVIDGARSSTFFQSVSINGVALTNATYTPLAGNGGPFAEALPVNGQGGTASQWAGGVTAFDASPWNVALAHAATGSRTAPIAVTGGAGQDVLHLLGNGADYILTREADGGVAVHDNGRLDQNAILHGVELLAFADGTTFDLADLNAGRVTSATPFDPAVYLASYADLVDAFGTDLGLARQHWMTHGQAEHRAADLFDAPAYAIAHPEAVVAVGTSEHALALYAVGHFADAFDPAIYLASYGDLSAAFGMDMTAARRHWQTFGQAEHRAADLFDAPAYARAHPEAVAAVGAGEHELALYAVERAAGPFDAAVYLASYPDLARAFGADLGAARQHWTSYGQVEHRAADLFDAPAYARAHPDAVTAVGTDEHALALYAISHANTMLSATETSWVV